MRAIGTLLVWFGMLCFLPMVLFVCTAIFLPHPEGAYGAVGFVLLGPGTFAILIGCVLRIAFRRSTPPPAR